MTDLSRWVSEDSRTPLQRLRRHQLHKIADSLGIQYPPGAPKTTMIPLLEGNGVDVTSSAAGIRWQVVHGTDANGRPRQEMYPLVEEHTSAKKGVNAEMVLAQKLTQEEKKEQEFKDSRIEALERENAALKEMLEKEIEALKTKRELAEKSEKNNAKYWVLYRQAKERGLEVHRRMKLEELQALLDGEDTP